MPELIFPTRSIKPEHLTDEMGQPLKLEQPCGLLSANTPYCLSGSEYMQSIPGTLGGLQPSERENLMCSMDILDQNLLKVADLYDRALSTLDLQKTGSLVGAGTTASHARLSGFQKAIADYQKTLIELSEYSQTNKNGRPAAAKKSQLKAAVQKAYKHLQLTYQAELRKAVTPAEWGKNRGSALSSAKRGITVASRRKYRQLNIQNGAQAMQLAKFTKHINSAGNGLIILDAGLRVNSVHNTYRSSGNWQRQTAMEITGFGAGGATGLAVGQATAAGLTSAAIAIGLAVTPIGWVVIVGTAIAVGYIAASAADNAGQTIAGRIYDNRLF